MDASERAYRKNEQKEREYRKRNGIDDNNKNEDQQSKKREQDYDNPNVPDGYSVPVAVLIEGRLMVGPPLVTKRQQNYVKKELGNPELVPLVLPPLAERKLWKLKEAVVWYENYARTFAETGRPIYLYHETGCKEEALVGLLVWRAWTAAPAPPNTHEAFMQWRERTGYLWFLDREEESLLPIALETTTTKTTGATKGLLTTWLVKKK